MAVVLCFTKNFAMRQSIITLTYEKRKIFFFDNRLEFLVCATIFDNPYILIDTVHERKESIRWICLRLAERGLFKNVYFIAQAEIAKDSFFKAFGIISTIEELKNICHRAAKLPLAGAACSLISVLHHRLNSILSEDCLSFLINIYDPTKKTYLSKGRPGTNKLYYLRCKLCLGSSLELKQLISILSSDKISRKDLM
ncbi:hypothetical protein LWM52_004459 [Escherichia coli]|nr:hypothetical protein [Escherichia coli]